MILARDDNGNLVNLQRNSMGEVFLSYHDATIILGGKSPEGPVSTMRRAARRIRGWEPDAYLSTGAVRLRYAGETYAPPVNSRTIPSYRYIAARVRLASARLRMMRADLVYDIVREDREETRRKRGRYPLVSFGEQAHSFRRIILSRCGPLDCDPGIAKYVQRMTDPRPHVPLTGRR